MILILRSSTSEGYCAHGPTRREGGEGEGKGKVVGRPTYGEYMNQLQGKDGSSVVQTVRSISATLVNQP